MFNSDEIGIMIKTDYVATARIQGSPQFCFKFTHPFKIGKSFDPAENLQSIVDLSKLFWVNRTPFNAEILIFITVENFFSILYGLDGCAVTGITLHKIDIVKDLSPRNGYPFTDVLGNAESTFFDQIIDIKSAVLVSETAV